MKKNYDKIKNQEFHRVTSCVVIHKNGKYLITKRSNSKKVYPGKWAIPGGGLNTNDYINKKPNKTGFWLYILDKSLRREIFEEVNLQVGKIKYLLDFCFIQPDRTPVINFGYYAQYKKGKIKLSSEDSNFAWVTPNNLSKYDLFPGIEKVIYEVDDILNRRNKKI